MKIAYILFDGITLLDFVGFYDPVSRLVQIDNIPEVSWEICGFITEVADSHGLRIKVDKVRPDLSDYDMIFLPGGFGTRTLLSDASFLNWIRSAEPVPYKVSVCTGSLILGAAGFLKGRRATTHFNEYDALSNYCDAVVKKRIVADDGVITAGAVASSLDLGLYICEKLAGPDAREAIRKSMALAY